MRLSDHLGKGIWGAADKGLPVIYGLGYMALVVRVLPEVELGNFVLLQTLFLVVSGLAGGFALQPLLKFGSEQRSDIGRLVGTGLLLNFLFVAGCSLVIVLLRRPAAGLLKSPALIELLWYLPAMLFASFIRNFALILLQTRYRIQQIFWTDAVHFIGAVTLIYVWSKLHSFDSALDLVVINLISLSFSSLFGLYFCREYIGIIRKPNIEYIRLFWGYGKFMIGGILSYLFYSSADYFFLSAFSGPAQVGVYNAVKTFVRIFDTMQQVIQMFVLPAVSRLSSIGDSRSLKVLTEKAICFGTIGLLPILVLFVIFARPLMSLVSGGRFTDAAPLLQLFGLLALVTAANAVASNVLLGLGRAKEGFHLSIVLLIASAAFYLILVPPLGALGATLAYLASSAFLTWLTVRKVQQFVPVTLREIIGRVRDITAFLKTIPGRI